MVLITGSTGFVGRHLIDKLILEKLPVRALLRPGSFSLAIKDLPIEKIIANPFDLLSLRDAFREVECVIHCAGVLHGTSQEDFYKGNVLYTENLLKAAQEYAPNLKKFIFISTQSAAGPNISSIPKKESDPATPISLYGESKWQAEEKVRKSNLPYLILRPCSIYGENDTEFLPLFQLVRKGIFFMVGNGKNRINLIYIHDFIQAIWLAYQSSITNKTYFVCGEGDYSYREVVSFAENAIGKKALIIRIPRWVAKTVGKINTILSQITHKPFLLNQDKVKEMLQSYWLMDSSAIRQDLKFMPQTHPLEGFKKTYLWYLQNGKL